MNIVVVLFLTSLRSTASDAVQQSRPAIFDFRTCAYSSGQGRIIVLFGHDEAGGSGDGSNGMDEIIRADKMMTAIQRHSEASFQALTHVVRQSSCGNAGDTRQQQGMVENSYLALLCCFVAGCGRREATWSMHARYLTKSNRTQHSTSRAGQESRGTPMEEVADRYIEISIYLFDANVW